jgi:hypothetical protein
MTQHEKAPGRRSDDAWKLPDVVARNEFAADEGTKREFAKWMSGAVDVPCVVCTREGKEPVSAPHRRPIFDIYSEDAKDVIGICEPHFAETGALPEGYFLCHGCRRTFIGNYSYEPFRVMHEGVVACINCARATYLRIPANWIDLHELPEVRFELIRKSPHLFAVAQDKTGQVAASGLAFIGRAEFDIDSAEQITGPTIQRLLETARDRGFSRAVLILDEIHRFTASIGVYARGIRQKPSEQKSEPRRGPPSKESWRMGRQPTSRERTTKDGAVIITRNQLVLLQGLYDRPGGTAPSVSDWIKAAWPHLLLIHGNPYASCLKKSAPRMNPAWVRKRRNGNRFICSLTARGRGILEGTVRAHVFGAGEYRGVRHLPPIG